MSESAHKVLEPDSLKKSFYLTAANVTFWLAVVIVQVLLLSEIASLKNIYIAVYIGTGWSVFMHAVTVASLFGLYKNNLSHIKGFIAATAITVVISITVLTINVSVFVLLKGYTTASKVLSGFTSVLAFYIFIESCNMLVYMRRKMRFFEEKERMLRIHKRLDQEQFYQTAEIPIAISLVSTNNPTNYFKNNIKFKYQRF